MTIATEQDALAPSILDTDLYKLTMQQAVLEHFATTEARYKFNNRSKGTLFSKKCFNYFQNSVSSFSQLILTPSERSWLETRCPYFKPAYLDFLAGFRFKPDEQITIEFIPSTDDSSKGQIEIEVHGLWVETILYEVPVMAALSDAFFRTVDTDWEYEGQEELAHSKGLQLLWHGIMLSEFGTRRRRSLKAHYLVIKGLVRAHQQCRDVQNVEGELKGTSNVHFAHIFDLTPIGTIAHEWTMGTAALANYELPNTNALALWETVYPPEESTALHIALTDTYSSAQFFKELKDQPDMARRWRGLRQDSGDPKTFLREAKVFYESIGLGAEIGNKAIVFSDGLDVDKCLDLASENATVGFQASFGVGTFLTNDFRSKTTGKKSPALNIVIKLSEVDGKPCIKLSDDKGKNTGDADTVSFVRTKLGIKE